jgi:hypothetical protein
VSRSCELATGERLAARGEVEKGRLLVRGACSSRELSEDRCAARSDGYGQSLEAVEGVVENRGPAPVALQRRIRRRPPRTMRAEVWKRR